MWIMGRDDIYRDRGWLCFFSLFIYVCVSGGGVCVRGDYESVNSIKFFILSLCVMREIEGWIDKYRRVRF